MSFGGFHWRGKLWLKGAAEAKKSRPCGIYEVIYLQVMLHYGTNSSQSVMWRVRWDYLSVSHTLLCFRMWVTAACLRSATPPPCSNKRFVISALSSASQEVIPLHSLHLAALADTRSKTLTRRLSATLWPAIVQSGNGAEWSEEHFITGCGTELMMRLKLRKTIQE